MRKSTVMLFAAVLISVPAFASYWVVLKDGTKYQAKSKWTVIDGKAVIQLETGQSLQLDPNAIDVARSEESTRLGGLSVLAVDQAPTATQKKSSLGSGIHLRKLPTEQTSTAAPTASTANTPPPPVTPVTGTGLSNEVLEKFERAYENVGIFEHKITPTGAHSLRADLTADNEEKVFNAISATYILLVRNAGVPGVQIDVVELFMKTTTGGSSGRFQMTQDDAKALAAKQISREEYFVRKVLY